MVATLPGRLVILPRNIALLQLLQLDLRVLLLHRQCGYLHPVDWLRIVRALTVLEYWSYSLCFSRLLLASLLLYLATCHEWLLVLPWWAQTLRTVAYSRPWSDRSIGT